MENNLTSGQRQKLQIGVIVALSLFLLGYLFFLFLKNAPQTTNDQSNNQVVFQAPLLRIFQYKENVQYPDTIRIHYPYLLVVRKNEGMTQIYNLQTKKKEKMIKQDLLDYFDGIEVYNKEGKTYVGTTNLNVLCDLAYIKDKQNILCTTRSDASKTDTSLIQINSKTLTQNTLYSSQDLITAIYYQNDTIYCGLFDPTTQKASIYVNGKTIDASDWVNLIYPMNNQVYFSSFGSVRNKNTESYYLITTTGNKLIGKEKIILN